MTSIGASPKFGAGRLFLADARLALAVANHLRYLTLEKTLGISREQANVVTVVLALTAGEVLHEAAKAIPHPRLPAAENVALGRARPGQRGARRGRAGQPADPALQRPAGVRADWRACSARDPGRTSAPAPPSAACGRSGSAATPRRPAPPEHTARQQLAVMSKSVSILNGPLAAGNGNVDLTRTWLGWAVGRTVDLHQRERVARVAVERAVAVEHGVLAAAAAGVRIVASKVTK